MGFSFVGLPHGRPCGIVAACFQAFEIMTDLVRALFVVSFAVLVVPAWGDIYKSVDENGNITFSNTPSRGAQRVFVESGQAGSRPSSGNKAQPKPPSAAHNPSPAHFPRVDAGTQRERDSNRRRILEEELSSEQRQLQESRQRLKEAEGNRTQEERANPTRYLERLARLRDNMTLHEKNIGALQSELARTR